MKKKLFAILSLVMILAMQSVTVFATETRTPSSNSGNVETYTTIAGSTTGNGVTVTVTVNKESGTYTAETSNGTKLEFKADDVRVLQALTNSENPSVSEGSENTQLAELSKETIVQIIAEAATALEEMSQNYGANAVSFTAVDIQGTLDENGGLKLKVSNANKGDNYYVLHFNGSQWEKCTSQVNEDGVLDVTVPSGTLSPFIIIKFDRDVTGAVPGTDYSTQSATNTVSGDVSPKTADAYPYAATIAAISIIAIAACTRKLAKR